MLKLTKKKKGALVGKMIDSGSYINTKTTAPGIVIEIGNKTAFIPWKELETWKASKSPTLELN